MNTLIVIMTRAGFEKEMTLLQMLPMLIVSSLNPLGCVVRNGDELAMRDPGFGVITYHFEFETKRG
jgi:hypothetical protein